MPAAAIIGAVGSIGGALISANGARSAAHSQEQGQLAGIAEQRRQYDQSRADEQPYMQYGQARLGDMSRFLSGDYSGFHTSPDYNFAMQQGIQGLDRSAAAKGGLFGGGHLTDLVKFNQGMAEQQVNNYWSKLQSGANLGQDATARTGALGAEAANQIGNGFSNIGDARAMGAIGTANSLSQGLSGLAGLMQSSYGQESISPMSAPDYQPYVPDYQPTASWGG